MSTKPLSQVIAERLDELRADLIARAQSMEDAAQVQQEPRALTDEEIEALAVKHEAFGFGQVDKRGLTTPGFDPDGLRAFTRAVLAAHTGEAADRSSLPATGGEQG